MTTPSLHDANGINVHYHDPVWRSGGSWIRITRYINSYSHTINAFGGYGNASINLAVSKTDMDDWLTDGLGRDIQVFDGDGVQIYGGFVNKITLNIGAIAVSRGPLSAMANRVSAMYVPIIDETTDPPVVGDRTETTIAENTISQASYGIIEKVLSAGQVLDVTAESLRDTYLEENHEPETTQSVSLGGAELTLTLECAGYMEIFDHFVYNNTSTPISLDLTTKILAILTAEQAVNGIISTNTTRVGYNGVLTVSYEDENRTAGSILKGTVERGGALDERWLFGIYQNRMAVYQAMPNDVTYTHRLYAYNQRVELVDTATPINPWNVMPGKWLFLPDLMGGFVRGVHNLRNDPRAIFIESVTYTAPYGLSINGSKVATLPQKLAKLGLGGIG